MHDLFTGKAFEKGKEMMSAEDLKEQARQHLLDSAAVKVQVAEGCLDSILAAATAISDSFKLGGKLLLCGNGGSAADCQHVAAEFVNYLNKDFKRDGLPAIALTTDTSFLTSFTNDNGFEGVFERQVETLGNSGDVLIGISTSGNSKNVVRAINAAQGMGIKTIVLCGCTGSLSCLADIVIAVPSENTQFIQEAHLAIEHILCALTECLYFKV
jgi:phosphoheptose isomerase